MKSHPPASRIKIADGKKVLNFCANNYFRLGKQSDLIESAKRSYDHYGFGLASVRFICGTQTVHKELEERKLSNFLAPKIPFSIPPVLMPMAGFRNAIGSRRCRDHRCIKTCQHHRGIRLCKAKRLRYNNNDMADLENQLKEAQGSRFASFATDGVFSMDGVIPT